MTNPVVSKNMSQNINLSSSDASELQVKIFQGSKPAIKNWRIAGGEADAGAELAAPLSSSLSAPENFDDAATYHAPVHERLPLETPLWLKGAQVAGVALSFGWLTYAVFYVVALPPQSIATLASPLALGGFIAAVLAPIALVWVCLATLQRRNDAQIYAEALRAELQRLLFPTPDQAKVVNRDIQLLVQQAVELSSSSRTAIKAIQTARQGMRAEVRDFAAVSQKTEFHIDRLAETLNKRADDLLTLTSQLEQRTSTLVQGAEQHAKTWDQSVHQLTNRADHVAKSLAQGSAHITQAISEAEDKVRVIASSFTIADDRLSARAASLKDVADKISDHAQTLDTKLSQRLESLVETKDKIVSGLNEVESSTQALTARGEVVAENIKSQTRSLQEAVAQFGAYTKELDQVGARAVNQLGDALSMALSGSESILTTVQRAREHMERAAQETLNRVTDFEGQAATRSDKLSQVIDQHITQIKDLLEAYDSRTFATQTLLGRLDVHTTTANKVADRLDHEVTQAVARLEASGDQLKSAADAPVEVLREMTTQMAQTISDMAKMLETRAQDAQERSEKVQENAVSLTAHMQQHVQELATLTGQIIGQTRTIESQISTQRSSLSGFTQEASSKLEGLQKRLSEQSQNLMIQVRETETAIQNLGQGFSEKSTQTLSQAAQATSQLRATEDEILERLVALAANATQTQFTVQDVAKVLRDAAAETFPIYEKATTQAHELERSFTKLDETVRATAGDVNVRMKDIAALIKENLENLDIQSSTTTQNLAQLSDGLKGQTDHIIAAADVADEKLRGLQVALKTRAEDVQLISDQAALRLESLRKQLDSYVKDLTQNVAASITQLSSVNDVLHESAHGVDEKSRAASEKLRLATQDFVEEGHRLSLLAEQAAHKAVRVVESVRDESVSIADVADQSLASLRQASDSFAARAREIEEYMKTALRTTQSTSDALKTQVQAVATQSAKTVDSIVDHILRLSSKAEETRQMGDRISQNVDLSREKLASESERLLQVTRKASQSAEDTAQSFVRNSDLILKATADISQQTERLKETQSKAQRESFLASVKFVVESLHSLAVDVARHLESDIDDKAWKSFQKGDVASFTRRLIDIAPHIPLERAQEKFQNDGEFRNYTLRYLRQFEDMIDQARTLDHGELLSGAFASSDMAKLYRILCDIAGRPSRL